MAKKRTNKRPQGRPQQSKQQPVKQQPVKQQPAARPAARPAAKPTRAERIEAAQRERRRRQLRTRLLVVAAVVAVVAVIATIVINNRRSSDRTVRRLEAGGCAFDRRADSDAGQGRNHVGSPVYEVEPPAGGNHTAQAAPPRDYGSTPVPDGQVVHAMEHGDIVLWYRPDVGDDALTRLREISDRYANDVLIVSRPSLTVSVAATAWHRRLLCEQPDFRALDLFASTFRDKGPEDVEEQG